jgi:ankyrin repeat protein
MSHAIRHAIQCLAERAARAQQAQEDAEALLVHANAQIDALQADAAAWGDVTDLADIADTADVLAAWRARIHAWTCEARTAAQTAEVCIDAAIEIDASTPPPPHASEPGPEPEPAKHAEAAMRVSDTALGRLRAFLELGDVCVWLARAERMSIAAGTHTTRCAWRHELFARACTRGDARVVGALLFVISHTQDQDQHPDLNLDVHLGHACKNGHAGVVRALLADGRAAPSHDCLYDAISLGDAGADVVALLLQDGRADPAKLDNFGWNGTPQDKTTIFRHRLLPTPCLLHACERGNVRAVEMMLKDGRADPAAGDNACVYWAAFNGCRDVVDLLLRDARVQPGDACLCVAASMGHVDIVRRLLEDGRTDPAATMGAYGPSTSLFLGCSYSLPWRAGVVRMLLQDGRADPAAADRHGRPNACMRMAAEGNVADVMDLLLKDGRADPACQDNECLRLACARQCRDVVALLLNDKRVADKIPLLEAGGISPIQT